MRNTTKRKSIANKVIQKVALTIFIINALMILSVKSTLENSLSETEERFMSEVLFSVTQEVSREIETYQNVLVAMSKNSTLRSFLLGLESEAVPYNQVLQHDSYILAKEELNILADMFRENTILDIGLGSVYLDNFVTNVSTIGSEDFSLATRPYYQAITKGETYVSDPYEDHLHKVIVVSIAHPVLDYQGRAIGVLLIDVVLDKLGADLSSNQFGKSGTVYIVDGNYNVIYHPDASMIGLNIIEAGFGGDAFRTAVQAATGEIIVYTANDTLRTGGILPVNNLTGWKIVSAMDHSEFHDPISDVIYLLNLTNVVILLVSSFFCVWGISTHLAPLKKLEKFVQNIAKGDLHSPIDFESDDEIGSLAQEMDICVKTVVSTIRHIDATLMEFGKGNFQLDDTYPYVGDFQSIRTSMEHFVRLMSGSLQDLKGNVLEVGQGAHLVSHRAQTLASGAAEQTQSVQELQTLIDEINSTILETAKQSGTVTSNAKDISEDLVESNDKMLELATSVKDIKTMSNEVKQIIKAIEEVAFQTNILALNAAVEAARAGEVGRGFAVVADEVRNLSLKTTEAVADTTKIINNIALAIETGSDLAQNTSHDLQQVVEEVDRFVTKVSGISLSANNQAEAIDKIHQGIAEITAVVNQNSAISEESAAASEELSSQSTVMMDSISRFRLKETAKGRF